VLEGRSYGSWRDARGLQRGRPTSASKPCQVDRAVSVVVVRSDGGGDGGAAAAATAPSAAGARQLEEQMGVHSVAGQEEAGARRTQKQKAKWSFFCHLFGRFSARGEKNTKTPRRSAPLLWCF
jgi:hypothetical protein